VSVIVGSTVSSLMVDVPGALTFPATSTAV